MVTLSVCLMSFHIQITLSSLAGDFLPALNKLAGVATFCPDKHLKFNLAHSVAQRDGFKRI